MRVADDQQQQTRATKCGKMSDRAGVMEPRSDRIKADGRKPLGSASDRPNHTTTSLRRNIVMATLIKRDLYSEVTSRAHKRDKLAPPHRFPRAKTLLCLVG
jgi:hypothetical protein